MNIYISRNFTEIGPFTMGEVEIFLDRGVFVDTDFGHCDLSPEWHPLRKLVTLWQKEIVSVESVRCTYEPPSEEAISSAPRRRPGRPPKSAKTVEVSIPSPAKTVSKEKGKKDKDKEKKKGKKKASD